ncbi:tetratricopeptide repeat protein [Candidatus Halobeggiatoa sp. HSG11]|nr:tetratricopeptide repeat protein [Candidatus Halobeggiatoa sp. HSG11]
MTTTQNADKIYNIEKVENAIFQEGSKEALKPILPPKNEVFVGRKQELQDLAELAKPNELVIINGIGGVGKTSFAVEYFHKHKKDYDYLAFVAIKSDLKTDFVNAFQAIFDLKFNTIPENFQSILSELNNKSGLLLVDDLQDINDLESNESIKSLTNSFTLLITTRLDVDVKYNKFKFNLQPFSLADAKELFLHYYNEDSADIDLVLEYLDYHALFVELTAKSLANSCQTVAELLQEFEDGRLAKVRLDRKTDFNVYLNQRFELADLDAEVQEILIRLSLMPSFAIGFQDLEEYLQQSDNKDFWYILVELSDKGWLIKQDKTFKLHQIIKEFLAANYPLVYQDVADIVEFFGNRLYEALSTNPLTGAKYTPFAQAVLERIGFNDDKGDQEIATVYSNLSVIHKHLSNLDKALEFAFKALSIRENVLDENHPDLATSYAALYYVYQGLGNLNKALEFALKDLEISEKVLDKNHPNLATSNNNLSIIHKDLGNLDKALEFALKALSIRENVLDKNHPDLAQSYNNLSIIHQDLGNLAEALEFALKANNIWKEVLDKNHPDLAASYNNLSTINYSLGNLYKALKFALKALNIYEKVLDKNHPDLAVSNNNLSIIHKDLGNLDKALKFAFKANNIWKEILDKNHPNLATSYNNLSLIYQDLGNLDKALDFALKALNIREQVLDKSHPDFAQSYNNLSLIYQDLGNKDKAKQYILKAIGILEFIFPNGHPNLDVMRENLQFIEQD